MSATQWCPVAGSDAVAKGPVHVELTRDELVVFRTASGTLAALQARCPHRGMLLSCGAVRGEVITCPLHGWSFDRHGRGATAAGQDRGLCAVSYDTHEAFGLVWVRSPGAPGAFPAMGLPLVASMVRWFLRRLVRSVRGFRLHASTLLGVPAGSHRITAPDPRDTASDPIPIDLESS